MTLSEDKRNWPSKKEVQLALLEAVKKVYECDRELVEEAVNERSIMFHVGRYLAKDVDLWGSMWHVDLDYNRMHPNGKPEIKRIQNDNGDDSNKLPDLIIHDRRSSKAGNLLVLEAKKAADCHQRNKDLEKLVGLQRDFNYRHAVYLELSPGLPKWQWRDLGEASWPKLEMMW